MSLFLVIVVLLGVTTWMLPVDATEIRHTTRNQKRCACARMYIPVCGEDGKSYPNPCSMDCRGVKKKGDGKCKSSNHNIKPCDCSEKSEQVCGKDGKTYLNSCKMQCQDVEMEKEGAC